MWVVCIWIECVLAFLGSQLVPWDFYHLRMWVGNVLSHVCLSVHLAIHLPVCLSVQARTFESFHIGTSFLVWRYILTISSSSLSIKVIRSRSCTNSFCLLILTCYSFICGYRSLIRSRSHIGTKVTYRGQYQGQIKVIFIKCVLVFLKCSNFGNTVKLSQSGNNLGLFRFVCEKIVSWNGVSCMGRISRSRSNHGHFKERCSYAGGLHLNQMYSCF